MAPPPIQRQESTMSTMSRVSQMLTTPKDPRARVFGLGITCMVLAVAEVCFFMWVLSISIQYDLLQEACGSSSFAVISGLYLCFAGRILYLLAVRRYCEAATHQWLWWYATFASWIFNTLLIVWCFSLQDYFPIALAALALIFYSVFFKYAKDDINKLSADCLCQKNMWCKGYEKGIQFHKMDQKKVLNDPEFNNLLAEIQETDSVIFESESNNLSRNPSYKSLNSRSISRNPSFKESNSRIVSRNSSFTSIDRSRKASMKSKDVSRSSSFNSKSVSRSNSFKNTPNINSNNNVVTRMRMTTIRQESCTTLHCEEDRVDNSLQADMAEDTELQLRSYCQDGQNDSEGFYGEVMKSLRKSGMVPYEFQERIPFMDSEHENITYTTEYETKDIVHRNLKLQNDIQELKNLTSGNEVTSHASYEYQDKDISVQCVNNDKLLPKSEDCTDSIQEDHSYSDITEQSNINKKESIDLALADSIKLIKELIKIDSSSDSNSLDSEIKESKDMISTDSINLIIDDTSSESNSLETGLENKNEDKLFNEGSNDKLDTLIEPERDEFASEESAHIQDGTNVSSNTQFDSKGCHDQYSKFKNEEQSIDLDST